MNIVFYSHREVFPVDSGAPTRIYNLARTIADSGENVYLVVNSRTQGTQTIGNLKVLSYPFTVGGFLTGRDLARTCGKIKGAVDVIQCEFPYHFPTTFMAKILLGNPPLVLDQHGVEFNIAREAYLKRPGTCYIASLLFRECAAVHLSTHIFTCSTIDSEHIARIYKVRPNKMTEIPNAVSQEFFEEVQPYQFRSPTILFLGGFRHPPNLRGARVIKDVIVPMVTRTEKRAQFVFVGQEPPSWLTDTEHIKTLGYVPDVRPLIKGANVCIAPILQGSGTRLKILEYMALGKPVVSTSKGAEGIEVAHGTDIIIEDDLEKFSDHILRLLHDTTEADRLGQNAKRTVAEKYRWEKVGHKAIGVYQALCTNKA